MVARRKHVLSVPEHPHLALEEALWVQGITLVAGVDEAGRGAWAGPVVAAAVILPSDRADLESALAGVTDSKKLSPARREALYPIIHQVALAVGVGGAGPDKVDREGLIPATRAAMERAIAALALPPQYLLIDAVNLRPVVRLPQQVMFFGDAISLSIAAASIVAKVSRDRLMRQLDADFPNYGFAQHKGYGTAAHRRALGEWGPSTMHRHSYRPVAALINRQLCMEESYG